MDDLASPDREPGGGAPPPERWNSLALLALLTLLVCGLFAPDRGLWRDDVMMLSGAHQLHHAIASGEESWPELVAPVEGAPTRRLYFVPYYAALLSGHPRLFLQLLYSAVWLGIGLGASWLAAELFGPERRLLAFLAGALTVCATSDSYSVSVGSLTYNLSVLAYVLALAAAFRWVRRGGLGWLGASVLALSCSIWNTDAALTSLILSPVGFLAAGELRPSRRTLAALGAWLLASVPYAVLFLSALLDSASYARSRGFVAPAADELIRHSGTLFALNFLPWRWVWERPVFEWDPPRVIPFAVWVAAALLGTVLVAAHLRRLTPADLPPRPASRWLRLAGLFVLCAYAANGMYAAVQLSHLAHRTQLMSRVWVSLALALAVAALLEGTRGRPGRLLAGHGLWIPFVFLGILGGMERQDQYLSMWRTQRSGLVSILEQAPAIDPSARLVFVVPPGERGPATYNTYIGWHWMRMLYEDPELHKRVFVVSDRGAGCRPEPAGLRCWHERQRDCFSRGECPGTLVPYDRAVVFSYLPRSEEYRLETELPSQLRPPSGDAPEGRYDPEALIVESPWTGLAEDLLPAEELLGRWFPGSDPRRAP